MQNKLNRLKQSLLEYEDRLERERTVNAGSLKDTLDEKDMIELHLMTRVNELKAQIEALQWALQQSEDLPEPHPKL